MGLAPARARLPGGRGRQGAALVMDLARAAPGTTNVGLQSLAPPQFSLSKQERFSTEDVSELAAAVTAAAAAAATAPPDAAGHGDAAPQAPVLGCGLHLRFDSGIWDGAFLPGGLATHTGTPVLYRAAASVPGASLFDLGGQLLLLPVSASCRRCSARPGV